MLIIFLKILRAGGMQASSPGAMSQIKLRYHSALR